MMRLIRPWNSKRRTELRARLAGRRGRSGQATVEAAYLIPVVFLCLLLLLQPGILLYDIMVMQGAAAEGCRLLATKTDAAGESAEACEAYVKRRLASIPPQDQFHMHAGGCSWDIVIDGDETSGRVRVTIANEIRLLPLVDAAGVLFGLVDSTGAYSFEVSSSAPTQPSWAISSEFGLDPEAWVGGDR